MVDYYFTQTSYVDIFDGNLSVIEGINLSAGQSGIYRDVTNIMADGKEPAVLQTTYRLMKSDYSDNVLSFTVEGPAQTPAAARVLLAGRQIKSIKATANGKEVPVDCGQDGKTAGLRFGNNPDGVSVEIGF